jgi:hypothetical protein
MGVFDELDAQDPRRVPSDDYAVVPSKHSVFTQIEGDQQKFGQPSPQPQTLFGGFGDAINDFGRAVTNAATFGMGNRMKAGIEYLKGNTPSYSEGVTEQAQKSEEARQRSPYASIAGDVYGSLGIPAIGAENLALRAGAAMAPTIGRAAPAVGRAIGYGTTGAVTGAAQGAGSTYTGNPEDYVTNALIGGALGGALGSAGGAAFGRAPPVSSAVAPTQAELFAAKKVGYDALGQSGGRYEGPALARRADEIERQLYADRFHPRDSPASWRALEEARGRGAPGQPGTGYNAIINPGDIEFIVKGLNKIPRTAEHATDRESAAIIKRALNDFVENPPPGAVLPGTEPGARQASTLAAQARGDYAGYKRVQALDELINNATNTAGATGLGLQGELQKGVRSFIKESKGYSPASKAGYNRDEIARLANYARGTNLTSALRKGSEVLGGGSNIGTQLALAGGIGGGAALGKYFQDEPLIGAAAGPVSVLAGMGLRRAGNVRADREIAALRDMIAQRTPLYNYRTMFIGTQPGPGSPNVAKAARDAIATAILKQRMSGDQNAP